MRIPRLLFFILILGVVDAMYKVGIPLTYFLVSNDSYHLISSGCSRIVIVGEDCSSWKNGLCS